MNVKYNSKDSPKIILVEGSKKVGKTTLIQKEIYKDKCKGLLSISLKLERLEYIKIGMKDIDKYYLKLIKRQLKEAKMMNVDIVYIDRGLISNYVYSRIRDSKNINYITYDKFYSDNYSSFSNVNEIYYVKRNNIVIDENEEFIRNSREANIEKESWNKMCSIIQDFNDLTNVTIFDSAY